MILGGVLEFHGWRLSEACRHAELLGCDIKHAWFRGSTVCLRAEYSQLTANAIAGDVIAGMIALGSPTCAGVDGYDGLNMSTRISP